MDSNQFIPFFDSAFESIFSDGKGLSQEEKHLCNDQKVTRSGPTWPRSKCRWGPTSHHLVDRPTPKRLMKQIRHKVDTRHPMRLFLRAAPMRGWRSNTPMAWRPTHVDPSHEKRLGILDTGNAQVATSGQRRFAWGQTWIWLWFASSTPTPITPVSPMSPISIGIIFETCSLKELKSEMLWKCLIRSLDWVNHCSTYANLKAHSHAWRTNEVTKRTNMKHTNQTTLNSPKGCFWFLSSDTASQVASSFQSLCPAWACIHLGQT